MATAQFRNLSSNSNNNNLQKAPPIDLNGLHTPHKLAAFVVNVPTKKQEYSFLFNEETTANNNNSNNNLIINNKLSNQSSIIQTSKLNRNNTHYLSVNNLIPPSKSKKSKSSGKRRKKRAKGNKKFRHKSHLNKEEQDNIDIYDVQNNNIGMLMLCTIN